MRIKASFILGIRNAERTLKECLNGILMQDFPKNQYEIIIIDGDSDDRTLEIVKEFMKKEKNIVLLHNPERLSEGKGMSKDRGVNLARGEVVIFIDHDNIITEKDWLKKIMVPFEDKKIMASQSLLESRKGDTLFLRYVNEIGVEDPFAVPYSLVARAMRIPEVFKTEKGKYMTLKLNSENVLFGGANGCAFRKEVFKIINGYTRDVDVFARMAKTGMRVAIPFNTVLHHKTSANFFQYMKKKAVYFSRFIKNDYEKKDFDWTSRGSGISGKIRFLIMVMLNLSMVFPAFFSIGVSIKKRNTIWLMHPFYLFYMTLAYLIITMLNIRQFMFIFKKEN